MDIDTDRDQIFFTGDSTNDGPMFSHFQNSAGVSTIVDHLESLITQPTWMTRGAGGSGFVEIADRIITAKSA